VGIPILNLGFAPGLTPPRGGGLTLGTPDLGSGPLLGGSGGQIFTISGPLGPLVKITPKSAKKRHFFWHFPRKSPVFEVFDEIGGSEDKNLISDGRCSSKFFKFFDKLEGDSSSFLET